MYEFYLFLLALLGSAIAAYYDLKTTEVPDVIPISLSIVFLAAYALIGFTTGSFEQFTASLVWGLLFTAVGFAMYFLGQWGGGDAELLACMGFLTGGFSSKILPFPLVYLMNLFFVGAIYMLVYAVFLSLKNKKIWRRFLQLTRKGEKTLVFILLVIAFLSFFLSHAFSPVDLTLETVAFSLLLTTVLYITWAFAKSVEEVGFKKRIAVEELKVGDVLLSSKRWVGIDEKRLKEIKRSGRKWIWIKEGVRFAPAFFLALLTSYFFGIILLL